MQTYSYPLRVQLLTEVDDDTCVKRHTLQAEGQLYYKNDQTYVRFKEQLEGIDESVQTTIRWDGHQLLLLRQGAVMMRQPFIQGERTAGRYVTTAVAWKTTVETKQITMVQPTPTKAGALRWVYDLYVENDRIATYRITLQLEKIEEAK